MFDTLKRAAALCALMTAMFAFATPSLAQPTEAQKEAVKSACRSDYMAHCSSVTPGGEEALQCLAKNMSSLSGSCQSAVKAIEASAQPKSEPAKSEPAKTEAAPAAAPKTETAKPAAEPKGEIQARCGGRQADQRANRRHQERLPRRLSKGLRGRAARRRTGAGMPGKEQGQGVGGLRQGACRRRRWCGTSSGRWRRSCSGSRRSGARGGSRRHRAPPHAAA